MKKNNISILSHDKCTGCGACYNVCPVNAIHMEHDIDGFLSPIIDNEKCISCNKCIDKCPVYNPIFNNIMEPECYAAMASDDIRAKSSSGGIFTLFAEYVFDKKGIVCGAAYDENFLVEHIIIDKIDDINKLRGSKYLQSDTKKVYRELKQALDSGVYALFCGCPCQVGALNTFLGKEYANLLTIDLMCHGGPSPLLFQKYLKENYLGRELQDFSFRDKRVFGWSTEANAYFKDGTSEHVKRSQDDYYRAFLPCLSVRKSCGTCLFAKLPRQGDITLADFWGVRRYKESFDDGKGTSIVIVNNAKGTSLFKAISGKLKLNESVPLDYIKKLGQPLDKPFKNHPEHDRFFEIVRKNSIKKAFHYIKNRKFDVGVIGVWPGLNYGSVLTYHALQKTLKEMGLSPLMIDKPGASKDDIERLNTHSRRFAKEHFHISQPYALKDLHILNRHCDTFIIGSDQVWNYGISKNFGKSFYLDFANDDKKKIAYGVSFGHSVDFASPAERVAISRLMRRFDAIAVREDNGVQLCKDIYGVDATHVLDPVFLIDPEQYHELANRSTCKEETPYMLAYILDVTPEKKELILQMSRNLGLRFIVLLDGFSNNAEKNRKILDLDKNVRMNIEVYDWLYYFKNASYILTDSFHGTSYAILFGKQFLPLTNKRRGYARFESLARLLDFESRLVNEPIEAIQNKKYLETLNYNSINTVISTERIRCRNWLTNALYSTKIIDGMSSYITVDSRSLLQKEQVVVIDSDNKSDSKIKKHNNAIIFSCNDTYAAGVYINILAIEKKCPNFANKYIIYEDKWSKESIEKTRSISKKIEFVPFEDKVFIERNKDMFNDGNLKSFISRYGHYKLGFSEYLHHLKDFERIIFLDADVLVLEDISSLNDVNSIGWRTGLLQFKYNNKYINRPNAGVIVFHNSLPWERMSNMYKDYLLRFESDEIALCALVDDLGLKTIELDNGYNYVDAGRNALKLKNSIKIYHCAGRKKIWNSSFLRGLFPEFYDDLINFGSITNIEKDHFFDSRSSYIKTMLEINFRRNIYKMPIYNYNVNILAESIFKESIIYKYKYYKNINFRIRNTSFSNVRCYFDIKHNENPSFINFIKKNSIKSEMISNYRYYKYNERFSTFYIDCKTSNLKDIFNDMIQIFTELIESYNECCSKIVFGDSSCNTLS